MSYSVLVEEDHSGTKFATGRNKVFRKNVSTVSDGQAYIQSLILEGYKIKYASLVHDKVKKA